MVCPVRDWRGAAVWTQQHLIKVNAGPKKANRVGHQPTAFQRFWLQPVHLSKILQILSTIGIVIGQIKYNHPKSGLVYNLHQAFFYWTACFQ